MINSIQSRFKNLLKQLIFSVVIFVVVLILIVFDIIDDYTAKSIITTGAIYAVIALGLNLITGFTGQLALGHAGFMAIGAYSTAILVMRTSVGLFPAIIAGGIITAVFGIVIGFPTLRLRGDYLAIVTLGFGEIIRVILVNLDNLTGGASGLHGVPRFTDSPELAPVVSFTWAFIFLVFMVIMMYNLINSSHGRIIISIREDEIAADAMGINTFYYKMFAFVLSTFMAGIGGGLFAAHYGYLAPSTFSFMKSVDFLIIVVLGGMGSITGTVISAFTITWLQEALRVMKNYRLVIYPLILILVMIFRPQGLMGNKEFTIDRMKRWPGMLLRLIADIFTGKFFIHNKDNFKMIFKWMGDFFTGKVFKRNIDSMKAYFKNIEVKFKQGAKILFPGKGRRGGDNR